MCNICMLFLLHSKEKERKKEDKSQKDEVK